MRLARRRRIIACCASSWMLFASNTVLGKDAGIPPTTFTLSIDRQPLDGALQQLAKQAGLQVIFFSRVTEGVAAPAIQGEFTLATAMEELLAGSSLTFRVINDQTVEVRPARTRAADYPQRRDRVERESARVSTSTSGEEPGTSALQEVVVVGLAEQLVATRIATPLREIPQTVSVVSREQIRLQNSTDLAGVLSHAPGITMSRSNSLVREFYSRGYLIDSLHIDGGAGLNTRLNSLVVFMATPDLSEFDHVEILRGADALFSGGANPGGTVSLVRKRPQSNFAMEFNALAGIEDGQRVEIDVTGPLSDDGSLRGRVDAVYDREGYFYDVASRERKKIFGALEYDLGSESTLTAGLSYQWEDSTPVVEGLPFYRDGKDSRLPRDLALGFDWSSYRSRLGEAYLQYRHEFSADWALKVNAAGWRNEVEYAYGDFSGTISPATNRLDELPTASTTTRPNFHTQYTADATLMGTLDWFGWREELAIGVDWTRLDAKLDVDLYLFPGTPLGDVTTFDPAGYPLPSLPLLSSVQRGFQDQQGLFASVRVNFDAAWSMVAGARIHEDRRELSAAFWILDFYLDTVSSEFESDRTTLPYAAIMYSMGEHYSLYASYADIYARQENELLPTGRRIDPVTGVNLEAGIKGDWRGGAINASAVVYRIEQKNLPHFVRRPGEGSGIVGECCYEEASSWSRGVDLELSGELTSGWQIGAGYTYNENESPLGITLSTITPKHLLKAWTNFRLPGEYRRWELGGSLHAQSATESRRLICLPPNWCPPITFVQEPYAVLDLRAGFEIDSDWHVSLSVDNVFDKIYYESIDSPVFHGWYGPPRNATLRIDGRF